MPQHELPKRRMRVHQCQELTELLPTSGEKLRDRGAISLTDRRIITLTKAFIRRVYLIPSFETRSFGFGAFRVLTIAHVAHVLARERRRLEQRDQED